MYIKSIRLKDWKAYIDAKFEFPRPEPGKNVILIGANNGYGKTSLLEAIVLGLFGRDGLPLVGRAIFGDSSENQRDISYNDFLERAFHAQAKDHGRTSATVELTFESDTEEKITIERKWHFTGSGKHRQEEEEVRIWLGPDDDLLTKPLLDDEDEFIRSYVAKTFLPVHLAQFFLFDGEQVQRLAKQDMGSQVRLGIEGILGIPVLRELSSDLQNYSKSRQKSVGNVGDERIDRLGAEIRELESKEDQIKLELRSIEPKISPMKTHRDQLVKEIATLRGGDYASLKEIFEEKERFNRNLDKHREELRRLLLFDVAIAIAGKEVRNKTRAQLMAEAVREKWQLGKEQGEEGFSRFIKSVDTCQPELDPPLTKKQRKLLQERLNNAWHELWYPPPQDCAKEVRHAYLDESNRVLVKEKLNSIDYLAVNHIHELLDKIETFEYEVRKLDSKTAEARGIDEEAGKLAETLNELSTAVSELESRQRELLREQEGLKGQLTPKKQELAKLHESYHAAKPQLRRAALADQISTMINEIIDEAFPSHINDIAKAMTEAYKAMAHKEVVKKISIDSDCTVRLLGSNGRDLRSMDASAGESQIFALSLIAAIAKVSKRNFPIVMDTPLARLDPTHRKNVLKYFTATDNQVILLSQPDEVRDEYLKLIEPKILKSVHITHEEISDGIGKSQVKEGYFSGVAV